MIASVTILATGREDIELGSTVVYCHPASGLEIIDVLVFGESLAFWQDHIDNTYGKLLLPLMLSKGDLVQVIYKTLPKIATAVDPLPEAMVDFAEGDFESIDFT